MWLVFILGLRYMMKDFVLVAVQNSAGLPLSNFSRHCAHFYTVYVIIFILFYIRLLFIENIFIIFSFRFAYLIVETIIKIVVTFIGIFFV